MSMSEVQAPDLLAELQNDASGERRAQVLARLGRLHEDCLAAQRGLSDRDGYRRLQAAGVAVKAAIRIVETLPRTRGNGN